MNVKAYKPRKPRLLGVFAHPDDETFSAGGSLAQHVDQGGEAMVVSFTKGQRGQIRDPDAATRRTLARVREQEFYPACERLGVQHTLCLDYMDGSLSELDPQLLIGEVVRLIRAFQPDTVLTFDREGGYGHPDHVTVSRIVTHAFHQAGSGDHYPEHLAGGLRPHTAPYLYHSVFLRLDKLLGTELATWLNGGGEDHGASGELVNALPFFAKELTTLGFARDDVRTEWYPPGVSIIELDEVAESLFLILSGRVDLIEETSDGRKRVLARKGPGAFLGETSLLGGQPSQVDVVAASGVTCLVLARERPSLHAPRGAETRAADALAGVKEDRDDRRATTAIDVSRYVPRKFAAMSAHRTQYPIDPELLIASPLQTLLGTEYFFRVHPPRAWETALLPAWPGGREHEEAA